ncbi:MAG: hypothetical protein R6T91_08480 [Bacteroidales bacterium]
MLKKLENYISSRILLLKIEGTEKLSDTLAVIFKKIILLMFLGSFVLFLSIALALWLGELFESYIIGFLLLAGIHFLLLIILFIFRKPLLERTIKDEIVQTIFHQSPNNKTTDD